MAVLVVVASSGSSCGRAYSHAIYRHPFAFSDVIIVDPEDYSSLPQDGLTRHLGRVRFVLELENGSAVGVNPRSKSFVINSRFYDTMHLGLKNPGQDVSEILKKDDLVV